LHLATKNGYINLVHYFIDNKADINEVDSELNTPLHIASSSGYHDIVELLIKNNALTSQINNKQ